MYISAALFTTAKIWKQPVSIKRCMNKEDVVWTSPVVQQLRIRLPMQQTWVQSVVWEDSTCLEATKSMRHNY